MSPSEETCPYCDKPLPAPPLSNKDHIIPKIAGGTGGANVIRCCRPCNLTKGSMTPSTMRALADDVERYVVALRRIADRVDALVVERGL